MKQLTLALALTGACLAARERSAAFIKHYLAELDAFDPAQLSSPGRKLKISDAQPSASI